MKKEEIHIFIPAYNEEKMISSVIKDIRFCGFNHIYIIDDGSLDRTVEIAKKENAVVLRHLINRGAGAATQTALEYARKKKLPYVLFMDADGQHIPKQIQSLMDSMEKNQTDLIIGSRFLVKKTDTPFSRKTYNYIGNKLINLTSKYNYTDTQSGFRLLNKKAIHAIQLNIDNFGFCSEMILLAEKAGLKIDETAITVNYTDYSLNKGQNFLEGIRTIFSFWWKIIYN